MTLAGGEGQWRPGAREEAGAPRAESITKPPGRGAQRATQEGAAGEHSGVRSAAHLMPKSQSRSLTVATPTRTWRDALGAHAPSQGGTQRADVIHRGVLGSPAPRASVCSEEEWGLDPHRPPTQGCHEAQKPREQLGGPCAERWRQQ